MENEKKPIFGAAKREREQDAAKELMNPISCAAAENQKAHTKKIQNEDRHNPAGESAFLADTKDFMQKDGKPEVNAETQKR